MCPNKHKAYMQLTADPGKHKTFVLERLQDCVIIFSHSFIHIVEYICFISPLELAYCMKADKNFNQKQKNKQKQRHAE